jgi:hypothetical protein
MKAILVDREVLLNFLEVLQCVDHSGDVMEDLDYFLQSSGLFPDAWCETHERWHFLPVEDGDYDEPC